MSLIAPHPFGRDITLAQLRESFSHLKQNEERYRQLILLARQLPVLPESLRLPDYQLKGCENRVWLRHQRLEDGTFHFFGDSDGRIVRGVLALLLTAVEGKNAQQIAQCDLQALLQELGVWQQLSSSRSHGINSLIAAIERAAIESA
ncbi:MAG: cysteine desulfurase sulfur acceptor subunit CsdE [Enterobacteriaceae bacterium]